MLDIYKASAGSGKTFAITLEYFKIIFKSPTEYKNVLAVTFTNKATEEMKSRIINELHVLAEGRESDYGVLLKEALQLTDDQLKNKASFLRTLLLHDYGRLSVTTIDRFFQRILKAFTKELGIFPGYNVELDSDFVLTKAVDQVMNEVRRDAELRNWIGELMSNNVEEGKSWSVKSKIVELGEELFRENYMLLDRKIADKFGDKGFLKAYHVFLLSVVEGYEQRMGEIGEKAMELIGREGLELTDFKGGRAGCASYFFRVARGEYNAPTHTIRKGAEDTEGWATKTSANKSRIESIRPELMGLLGDALALFDRDYRIYLSAKQLVTNLYQLGILDDLYREVRRYCEEKGLMLLSDTTHILNLLIANNDTSFLFEKCGNYYNHLMIDEFQDTSFMQWKNFRPLVINSLAEGSRTMIVGDVKQSIYRWRNGDWGLLAHGVEEEFSELGVNNVLLKDNWRSAIEVVDFNNCFFKSAVGVLEDLYVSEAGEDDRRAGMIATAYEGLEQTPRNSKNGYVEIAFGPEKQEENAAEVIMREVVDIVCDIVERGGALKDVVILVRGAKEGAFVADYLMEYNKRTEQPLNFMSNDSLYVWSSPYVQFIMAVLQYIAEPYDMVNRAVILYFYSAFVKETDNMALNRVFQSIREDELFSTLLPTEMTEQNGLLSFSLYETIELIIDRFSLKSKEEEVPYLIAFQDIIYEYENANPNSINLFIEWWEKEKGKRVLATSEEMDAIRILTIHKSKGLEFEHVILPFCAWELDSVRPVRCIWCKNEKPGFDDLEYVPLNYSSKLADSLFKEDYLDEHLKAYIDNLNLLYVALTRAKRELYIRPFGTKQNKDGSFAMSSIGDFVFHVLSEMGETMEAGVVYTRGEKQMLPRTFAENGGLIALTHYPVWAPGNRISVKYRYRDYTDLENESLSAIDEGKLLHEIFKSINQATDVEGAVGYAYLQGLIEGDERSSYCAKIHDYINTPVASEWFLPKYKVINERDILFPGGGKARPDRVILSDDEVCVIDYKFGQNEEPQYLKQVGFYCNALRKMGYNRVEGYIWYVKQAKIVRV